MFEQILIRLGVDAKAVSTGLTQLTSLVRGWAAGIGQHLRGAFGGIIGFAAIERLFDRIKERIITVSRISRETGFSTTFIQSAAMKLRDEGEGLEKIEKPLANITALAGARGMTASNFLKDLAETYKKLNTQEERNLMLKELGIKNWQALIPLLQEGRRGIEEMERGNVFTTIFPKNISEIKQEWEGLKRGGEAIGVTVANIWGYISRLAGGPSRMLGSLFGGGKVSLKEIVMGIDEAKPDAAVMAMQEAADKEGVSLQQEKSKILQQEKELLREQLDLTNQLNDRNKSTIQAMASDARRLLGIKEPRALAVSPRMMEALNIDTMEKRAERAFQMGDDAEFSKLTQEALQMRASLGWAKAGDRDPQLKTVQQLEKVNTQLGNLEPVARMAHKINGERSQ